MAEWCQNVGLVYVIDSVIGTIIRDSIRHGFGVAFANSHWIWFRTQNIWTSQLILGYIGYSLWTSSLFWMIVYGFIRTIIYGYMVS